MFKLISLSLGISLLPLQAQQLSDASKADLIEQILTLREDKDFDKALKKAKEAKISPQVLFEAEFLYAIDKSDYPKLAKLIERLPELEKTFEVHQSEIFSTKDDWLAVASFIKAIHALENKQVEVFKTSIKEAFWLSPEQAPAFGPHIENFKIQQLKETFQFNFNHTEVNQKSEQEVEFKTLLGEKKGVLLYFYSPWSRESMLATEDVTKVHQFAEKNQLTHIQINIEQGEDAEKDNLEYVKSVKPENSHYWLQLKTKSTLLDSLRIKRTPTVIHLSPDGKILLHGSPYNLPE